LRGWYLEDAGFESLGIAAHDLGEQGNVGEDDGRHVGGLCADLVGEVDELVRLLS